VTRTDAEIGEMLSKWRSDTLKMSPAQVARKAGVAHSVVTRLESGGTVRRATMAKVGAALNLREGWIDEIRTACR
jgi:predicted transcriptional regulator